MKFHIIITALCCVLSAQTKAFSEKSSIADLQKAWAHSREVSSAELSGSWHRIGVWEESDCRNIMQGTHFDETGIKNPDGSLFSILFAERQVFFNNVGKRGQSQGPYEIISPKAEFSSWAYKDLPSKREIAREAYGSYHCRQNPEAQDQILCAVRAHKMIEANVDPTFASCSQHRVGVMMLLTKSQY